MRFHGLFLCLKQRSREPLTCLFISDCFHFAFARPGTPCLSATEFAGNCGPFSARAMGFLGSFSLAHVFPGLLVCTVQRSHFINTKKSAWAAWLSQSHGEKCAPSVRQPAALCAKYSREPGTGPSLHFTLEHTFASLLGRTSTAVSIWGVSQRSVVSLL